jgi:sugar O-acyltransferase (sialic acid O-acetyltransferase NeuD family)
MKLQIIGAGGFAKEVYSLIRSNDERNYEVICFMDRNENTENPSVDNIYGVPIVSDDEFYPTIPVVVAIGDPMLRRKIVENIIKKYPNVRFPVIKHQSATILDNSSVSIGMGSILCANTIITCDVKLGNFCQLNLATTIGHGATIDDFFTSAPSVNISGNTKIGKNVYFGTGSATKENINITDNVTIGMGSMVTKDINSKGTYVGIPSKQMM